ncbi:MAG: 4Fe-4S binding protein [Syntrophorhabdales bacterium]|jgi:heterodisulfide reductase subunit A-like polyferredoxin
MIPLIDDDTCTGCRRCMEVCPPLAIALKDKKARIEDEFCEECGFCAAECPVGAIRIPFPKSAS